ncbi:hypothetical protein AC1031_004261 [Aphanomyces cochlioides]|nr:hypothetical protein AC1031_004261 [Aphanomyces cochlioides]
MNRKLLLLTLRIRAWKRRRDLFMQYLAYHYYAFCHKTPRRNSCLSGDAWVQEKLNGNREVFVDMFRMPRFVFRKLLDILVSQGELEASHSVKPEEQLCTLLAIVQLVQIFKNVSSEQGHNHVLSSPSLACNQENGIKIH